MLGITKNKTNEAADALLGALCGDGDRLAAAQAAIGEPKLRQGIQHLLDLGVRKATAARAVEKAQIKVAHAEQRLTNADTALALGEDVKYADLRVALDEANGELWDARRQLAAFTRAEAEQQRRVVELRIEAEREVGLAARPLHEALVRRQLVAMEALHAADAEEEAFREGLASAFAQYAPDSTVARQRVCRYLRPMSSGLSERAAERFRREAEQHGNYHVD